MQFLISVFFGMVCAWAVKISPKASGLGHWRLVAGAMAGAFPYVGSVIGIFSESLWLAYGNGLFWSIALMPVYTNVIAYVLAVITGRTWRCFVPVTTGVLFFVILMALFTSKGVQLFAPFSQKFFAIGVIYPFDITVLGICVLVLALGFMLPMFKREIARGGMILIAAYIVGLGLCYLRAYNFANTYAKSFDLDVEKVYAIPQPISAFNWRVVIETKDQRYHDTMVNLYRDHEIQLDGQDSRVTRINSLYKPMDKAVWRVYRRYGYKNKAFAKSAWVSMYKSSEQFRWISRFWVAKDVIQHHGTQCARFVDLRREGSRRLHDGMFMICRENNGAALYKQNEDGSFKPLQMHY